MGKDEIMYFSVNFNLIGVKGIIFLSKTKKYNPPKLEAKIFWRMLIFDICLDMLLEVMGINALVSLYDES